MPSPSSIHRLDFSLSTSPRMASLSSFSSLSWCSGSFPFAVPFPFPVLLRLRLRLRCAPPEREAEAGRRGEAEGDPAVAADRCLLLSRRRAAEAGRVLVLVLVPVLPALLVSALPVRVLVLDLPVLLDLLLLPPAPPLLPPPPPPPVLPAAWPEVPPCMPSSLLFSLLSLSL